MQYVPQASKQAGILAGSVHSYYLIDGVKLFSLNGLKCLI